MPASLGRELSSLAGDGRLLRGIVAFQRELAAAEHDLDQVFRLVAERTLDLLDVDGTRVYWHDGAELVCRAAAGFTAAENIDGRIEKTWGFAEGHSEAAILVSHLTDDTLSRFGHATAVLEGARAQGIETFAAVPLFDGTEPSGLLVVLGKQAGSLDGGSAHEALQLLAGFVGDLVTRASEHEAADRLFAALTDSEDKAQLAAARTALQAEVSRLVGEAGNDYDPAVQASIEMASALTGDLWILRLIDSVGFVRMITIHDPDPVVAREVQEVLGAQRELTGLAAEAFHRGRSHHFGPDEIETGLALSNSALQPLLRRIGTSGIVAAPLQGRGGPIGSLTVFRHRRFGHSGDEVAFVLDLADRIALAVDNAHLLAQSQAELVERRRVEEALNSQRIILERIARGRPLAETLNELCVLVETSLPGAHCSVLLHEQESGVLRPIAAPTLPDSLSKALDGLQVADGVGACGTAAFLRRPVIVADVFADPLTAAFTDLCAEYGLRSVWSNPVLDGAGQVLGTFALYRSEIHVPDAAEQQLVEMAGSLAGVALERKRAEEALAHAAQHDPLTGLPNRSVFLDRLALALRRSKRRKTRVAVLFLDLDRFKLVNDSLGHGVGDGLLIEAAARLCEVVREGDTVARFGGDEFTVLCEDVREQAEAEEVAQRLGEVLAEPFAVGGGEFFLSASIGIALGSGLDEPEDLVADADAAMYRAKDRGRARHELFDAGMRDETVARVTLEAELRRALERNELVLHYQPVVSLATGKISGIEALARWQHPERGLIGPDSFIGLAEETGLIGPLGQWVVVEAARQAARWRHQGFDDLQVGVNVSARQLVDPDLGRFVSETLACAGMPADHWAIEITETAIMEDLEVARDVVEHLASLGIQLLIDDFGTGYSSIARLGGFPFAGIKVDRLFITTLAQDVSTRKVVGAVVELAHALGLFVVAEGVETAQALSLLRTLGCDYAQGYHMSPPLPVPEIDRLLALRRTW